MDHRSVTTEDLRLEGAGVTLAATRHASAAEAGIDILYAHGFGQTRGAWAATAATLAAHGHAGLSYDARGHGQSGRNPADLPYTGHQFTDDLIVLAGELPRPPVLVGASMGGLFGLLAEARWPGLFRAMVLVDITPRWESAGVARILAFMTAFPDGFASLDEAADAVAAYLPHRARKSPQALAGLLRQGDDGRWRWHWDPRLVDDMNRDVDVRQQQLVEAARRIDVPTLLVTGGASDVVSRDTIDEFLALVPHAEHHLVADARHLVAGDDNDAFAGAVARFLAGLGIAGTISRPVAVEP